MTRSKAVWFALLILVAGVGVGASANASGFFIEPEIGGRWISAGWGDMYPGLEGNVLGPGITLGGNLGFMITPIVGLVAHADLGFHGVPDDVTSPDFPDESIEVIDSGASLALLMGGRIYPMGGTADSPFQPYVGLGFGVGSIAWEYTDVFAGGLGEDGDGVGALLIALEAGGDMKLSESVSLGLGARYIFNNWADETVEKSELIDPSELSGGSFNLQAHVGFHF